MVRGNEKTESGKMVLVIEDPEAIRLLASFMESEIRVQLAS